MRILAWLPRTSDSLVVVVDATYQSVSHRCVPYFSSDIDREFQITWHTVLETCGNLIPVGVDGYTTLERFRSPGSVFSEPFVESVINVDTVDYGPDYGERPPLTTGKVDEIVDRFLDRGAIR